MKWVRASEEAERDRRSARTAAALSFSIPLPRDLYLDGAIRNAAVFGSGSSGEIACPRRFLAGDVLCVHPMVRQYIGLVERAPRSKEALLYALYFARLVPHFNVAAPVVAAVVLCGEEGEEVVFEVCSGVTIVAVLRRAYELQAAAILRRCLRVSLH